MEQAYLENSVIDTYTEFDVIMNKVIVFSETFDIKSQNSKYYHLAKNTNSRRILQNSNFDFEYQIWCRKLYEFLFTSTTQSKEFNTTVIASLVELFNDTAFCRVID